MNPLVPRPNDRPTVVDLDAPDWAAMDTAKIIAAPDDPADWPRWRAALVRWRAEARDRLGFDGTLYDQPDMAWASRCYVVSQVWLWDELLYDGDTRPLHARPAAGRRARSGSAGSTEWCCGTHTP